MTLEFNRSISENGLLLYMTDASVYGGANPTRESLGIVALATFQHSAGSQFIQPTAYTAETVTSFAFNVEGKDGVWKVNFWALPLYVGQNLAEGDVVYDVTGGRLIKKKIGGVLTTIAIESLLTDVDVFHSGSKYALVTTDLTIGRDKAELVLLGVMEELQQSKCEFQEYQEAFKNFNYIRALRSGSFIRFCRGEYITAQSYVETGNSFATKFIEESGA